MSEKRRVEVEFDGIFKRSDLTPVERLETAMKFWAAGRPGVVKVRERQERIKSRLRALRKTKQPQTQTWTPRTARWSQEQRAAIRARASGDAERALQIAEVFDGRVKHLYQSKRGRIRYGRGGHEHTELLYAKSYHFYARWKDAGVRVDYGKPPVVVLENHLGNEVARIPLSLHAIITQEPEPGVLVPGDLYAVRRHPGVWERFGIKKKTVASIGFAVEITDPVLGRFIEHGKTIKSIKAEIEMKRLAVERKAHADQLSVSVTT